MQNNQYLVVNYEDVNKDSNSDVLGLQVKAKTLTTKDGKKKFQSVKVMMNIRTFVNKDGKVIDKGYTNRWIDLHFTQDAFKTDCYEGCILKDIKDIKTGMLYVKADYVDAPNVYKVTKDEEGKDIYPSVWIKGGLIGFQKYKPTQNAFTYQPSVKEDIIDADTGEVVEDDNSTDYAQFDEEDNKEE